MICVLSKFNYNKLVLNNLSNFWSISLVIMLNSLGFWLVIKTLVSSANSIGVDILFKNKNFYNMQPSHIKNNYMWNLKSHSNVAF
jgi:hypothetical protein